MTMIEERYVSFEIARLLDTKDFDGRCKCYYSFNRKHSQLRHSNLISKKDCCEDEVLCPTHQMAMKWLRGKGIEIETRVDFDCMSEPPTYAFVGYSAKIYTIEKAINVDEIHIDRHETYEEAVDAALKYSLENLI